MCYECRIGENKCCRYREIIDDVSQSVPKFIRKYQDFETSPANETKEKIRAKLLQAYTCFYYIYEGKDNMGAIRVIDRKDGSRKRAAPVFILEKFRNKEIA